MERLADKSMTRDELYLKAKGNFDLLPVLVEGLYSSKATIRYACGSIVMNLSEEHPDKLYPYMNVFVDLLSSRYRILTWNAIAAVANLARVDSEGKFDAIFDKYFSFLNDEYMVTVANIVGNSSKIASAKPHLVPKITRQLLKVENISLTPHLTEECKRVIAEKTIQTFSMFFDRIEDEQKEEVLAFVKRHLNSSRKTLKKEAEKFLRKWHN